MNGDSSAASRTASTLREEILERAILGQDDEPFFLGSEDVLLAQLGVSRPTLRQAARILESEHLLEVRPGLNGGLFGHAPGSAGATQTTSVFLRSLGTTLLDISAAQVLVAPECARLAALHPDPDARKALLVFLGELEAKLDDTRTESERVDLYSPARFEFSQILAQLCGNPVVRLFLLVLTDLAQTGRMRYVEPQHIEATRSYYREVAEAVAAGDSTRAEESSRRWGLVFQKWVEDAAKAEGIDSLTLTKRH